MAASAGFFTSVPTGSTLPVGKLRACSPSDDDLKLTVYEGVDHNSWDLAYTGTGDDDVFAWMLEHTSL